MVLLCQSTGGRKNVAYPSCLRLSSIPPRFIEATCFDINGTQLVRILLEAYPLLHRLGHALLQYR